jgi:DNA sulfur modification protein DndD
MLNWKRSTRISDEHRESFSKIFNQVSTEKQVLLLLTPSEFSDDVKAIFHDTASSLSFLQMTKDETETQLKEAN